MDSAGVRPFVSDGGKELLMVKWWSKGEIWSLLSLNRVCAFVFFRSPEITLFQDDAPSFLLDYVEGGWRQFVDFNGEFLCIEFGEVEDAIAFVRDKSPRFQHNDDFLVAIYRDGEFVEENT